MVSLFEMFALLLEDSKENEETAERHQYILERKKCKDFSITDRETGNGY